jgi:hypothetical protein
MPFYEDMQQVARDLLAPDTAGGLGQGAITIVRTTPGTPDPAQPWVPVTPTSDDRGCKPDQQNQGRIHQRRDNRCRPIWPM